MYNWIWGLMSLSDLDWLNTNSLRGRLSMAAYRRGSSLENKQKIIKIYRYKFFHKFLWTQRINIKKFFGVIVTTICK